MKLHLPAFLHRWLGYREVEIPGYHCGCCGAWYDEPRKVWRRRGLLHQWDTIGLCSKCFNRTGVDAESAISSFITAMKRHTINSRRKHDDILFSERRRIAARVDAVMHLHGIYRDVMGVVTALNMIGGLKRPEPWPMPAESQGIIDQHQSKGGIS